MEVKVQIPFTELIAIIKQLSPSQKAKLQEELVQEIKPAIKKNAVDRIIA